MLHNDARCISCSLGHRILADRYSLLRRGCIYPCRCISSSDHMSLHILDRIVLDCSPCNILQPTLPCMYTAHLAQSSGLACYTSGLNHISCGMPPQNIQLHTLDSYYLPIPRDIRMSQRCSDHDHGKKRLHGTHAGSLHCSVPVKEVLGTKALRNKTSSLGRQSQESTRIGPLREFSRSSGTTFSNRSPLHILLLDAH